MAAGPLAEGFAGKGHVRIVPYDPAWPAHFEVAREAILAACNGVVIALEHVGSTAIPGIAGKPYIDLMPGLERFEDGQAMVEGMASLGYSFRGELRIPGRHYFSKWINGDEHVWKHNVHCYAVGHIEWTRHLVFRDALRADPALRDEYERLKFELAARFAKDIEAYADAKSEFVERVILAAGGPQRPADFPWVRPKP
jgi:GrpB-like predicted nucleotidyltransferase (UPF0157 family)